MKRHSENAMAVAEFLKKSDRVKKLFYPGLESDEGHALAATQMKGFSGTMSFVLDVNEERAMRFGEKTPDFSGGAELGRV